MEAFFNSIVYIFLFLTFYMQVFILITFFEERKSLANNKIKTNLPYYPSITMTIPCWNEEKTVEKTVDSLLEVNYPKDRLKIFVVDDGSKDRTWEVVQKFANHPQITLLKKENGGKHTALNMVIGMTDAELIGCLDADSSIEKNCLLAMADAFNTDKDLMAVSPVQIIPESKKIIQKMQRIEFYFSAFMRRMFSGVDAITVTPGPGTVFRKEVFEKIGLYKEAHKTEDCELTLRMQAHNMRIRNLHTAHVYTASMPTVYKLYKQRLRWSYGTMRNSLDYRFMMFNKEYGTFGLIILPFYFFITYIFLYNFSFLIYNLVKNIFNYALKISVAGFSFTVPKFDLFSFNIGFMSIMFYITLAIFIFILWKGTRISNGKPSLFILTYFLYGFLAPMWLSRAIFNLVFKRSISWR